MLKKILMKILDLLFRRKAGKIPLRGEIRRILVIRTDERLGEIILTLPLINHLRKAFRDAKIEFLMCKKYKRLSEYIDCDRLICFEKREFFPNIFRLVRFIREFRGREYDLVVLGGKISPPSLTSYLLLGIARGKFKAAIRQRDFNPFVNIPVDIETISEAYSKYELAKRISGANLPFDNRLKADSDVQKKYDAMLFTDARKKDHLLPLDFLSGLIKRLRTAGFSIIVVSGKESSDRIERLKELTEPELPFSVMPQLDDLIRLIQMSKTVIAANTGVMHLSVALNVPTCGIFINAPCEVWGYKFSPHFMIDARANPPDINEVVNFIKLSIKG